MAVTGVTFLLCIEGLATPVHRRLWTTFGAVAAVLVAGASCDGRTDRAGRVTEARTPIVFVHGSGLSSSSWNAMRRALASSGYPRRDLEAVEIPTRRTANDVAARTDITSAVERLLEVAGQHGTGKVDLIGHSMGAFSTRYFAAALQPERVRVWIGIAGSNYGTDALCGSPLAGDRQMCPAFAASSAESELQARLNGTPAAPRDPSPYGIGADQTSPTVPATPERCIAYYTIRIEPDLWIQPERSATLEGAGGLTVPLTGLPATETEPGNIRFTGSTDHDHLPSNPELIELVERILAAASRELPARCAGRG